MTNRTKERWGGLFILVIGVGLTALNWHNALNYGYYYPKLSLASPAFGCIGLGLLLFPAYKTERTARGEDISQVQGLRLITARWWLILIAGIGLGILNWYLLARLGD